MTPPVPQCPDDVHHAASAALQRDLPQLLAIACTEGSGGLAGYVIGWSPTAVQINPYGADDPCRGPWERGYALGRAAYETWCRSLVAPRPDTLATAWRRDETAVTDGADMGDGPVLGRLRRAYEYGWCAAAAAYRRDDATRNMIWYVTVSNGRLWRVYTDPHNGLRSRVAWDATIDVLDGVEDRSDDATLTLPASNGTVIYDLAPPDHRGHRAGHLREPLGFAPELLPEKNRP